MARILVIVDQPLVQTFIRDFLVMNGHIVTTVGDGRSGKGALERQEFEAVILDSYLAGQAADLRRELRQVATARAVPVILLDGQSTPAALRNGLSLPRIATLSKPFKLSRLASTLGRLVADGPHGGATVAATASVHTEASPGGR